MSASSRRKVDRYCLVYSSHAHEPWALHYACKSPWKSACMCYWIPNPHYLECRLHLAWPNVAESTFVSRTPSHVRLTSRASLFDASYHWSHHCNSGPDSDQSVSDPDWSDDSERARNRRGNVLLKMARLSGPRGKRKKTRQRCGPIEYAMTPSCSHVESPRTSCLKKSITNREQDTDGWDCS